MRKLSMSGRCVVGVFALAGVSGCSGNAVDIGGKPSSRNDLQTDEAGLPVEFSQDVAWDEPTCLAVEARDRAPNESEPTDSTAATPGDFVGTWVGYIESVAGADLLLSITESGEASLIYGERTATVPKDLESLVSLADPDALETGHLPSKMIAGFTYTVLGLNVEGQRLRFAVNRHEPYSSWCLDQPGDLDPHLCKWACAATVPNKVNEDGSIEGAPFCEGKAHCAAAALCIGGPCECTSAGCSPGTDLMEFDLTAEGDHATGSTRDAGRVQLQKR